MKRFDINFLSKILTTANVIIADGEFPKHQILVNYIKNAKNIICCDNAISYLEQENIYPTYIIGDCDSISNNLLSKYHDQIIQIKDQNYNDLAKAIELSIQIQCNEALILGATGLREDHTISNIAIASYYRQHIDLLLASDYGMFTFYTAGINNIPTFPGQQVSFFTFDVNTKVSCEQLKWPLRQHEFSRWNSGSLNEAIAFNLTLNSSNEIAVYQSFEFKR